MSKRLNKRQQRELEELEQLKAQETALGEVQEQQNEEKEDGDEDEGEVESGGVASAGPFTAFAALGRGDEADDDGTEEDEPEQVATPKKSKKKKPKKKRQAKAATPGFEVDGVDGTATTSTPSKSREKKGGAVDPLAGLDEVDRALAELNMKSHDSSSNAGPSRAPATSDHRQFMAFRNLLSVDPKNLDADAELRRFFGSKVIASSAQTSSNRHRAGPSPKLRYTISKPKSTYPPATSLAGLTMREMTEVEVEEAVERKGVERGEKGEKWFTFEHSPAWREVERQFMGAVRSHDPNELMALLQVYPWHADTLLQMSEVYRLQSDIGAASDYAERALYAFDRCLIPAFNVTSGSCRLDFDRVENRPMFTALHRIISYLGRRGCWVTAFNFAKLLYSLDPFGDPHGAALWLDFLAVKSGNGEWLISILEQASSNPSAAAWHGYPGMAYAQALALRADETSKKHEDHTESDSALQDAIKTFPQVVVPLADKIGVSLPDKARSHPLIQVQAGFTDSPSNVVHLLSHIYVSRSEALWKDPDLTSWFEESIKLAFPALDESIAKDMRDDALAMIQMPRDPIDEELNVPLFICRHVVCSESTSWLGFLPPPIRSRPVHAYDPLPPTTAISIYDDAYFSGLKPRRGAGGGDGGVGGVERELIDEGLMNLVMTATQGGAGWQERLADGWREFMRRRGLANAVGDGNNGLEQLMEFVRGMQGQAGTGNGGMPGGFPGQDVNEE